MKRAPGALPGPARTQPRATSPQSTPDASHGTRAGRRRLLETASHGPPAKTVTFRASLCHLPLSGEGARLGNHPRLLQLRFRCPWCRARQDFAPQAPLHPLSPLPCPRQGPSTPCAARSPPPSSSHISPSAGFPLPCPARTDVQVLKCANGGFRGSRAEARDGPRSPSRVAFGGWSPRDRREAHELDRKGPGDCERRHATRRSSRRAPSATARGRRCASPCRARRVPYRAVPGP